MISLSVYAGDCSYSISQLVYAGVPMKLEYVFVDAKGVKKQCVDVTNAGGIGAAADALNVTNWFKEEKQKNRGNQKFAEEASAKSQCGNGTPLSYEAVDFGGNGDQYRWTCLRFSAETYKKNQCRLANTESSYSRLSNGIKINFQYSNTCECWLDGMSFEERKDCSTSFPFVAKAKELKDKELAAASEAERKKQEAALAALANTRRQRLEDRRKPDPVQAPAPTPSERVADAHEPFNSLCNTVTDAQVEARERITCICEGFTDKPAVQAGSRVAECKKYADAAAAAQNVAAPVEAPTEATKDLQDCAEITRNKVAACTASLTQATDKCDSKKLTADKEAQQIKEAAQQAYISTKAGTGAQQECFQASAASSLGVRAFTSLSGDCDGAVTTCNDACDPTEKIKEYETSCKSKINGIAVNQTYYDAKLQEFKSSFDRSLATCQGDDMKKNQKGLSDFLGDIAGALRSSVQCMCQLSSVTTTNTGNNCGTIPVITDCQKNPSLPNCNAYVGLSICTPGSTYDAKLCGCQMNPKGAGCPGGDASGNLVGFASGGNLAAAGGGNEASIGNPGANLKPSAAADLSGINNQTGPAANLKLSDTPKGTSPVAGGGGPSGGGGPMGGGDVPQGGSNVEESSGISGLLNQAKTFVSNIASGGDKSKQNGSLGKDSKTKPNIDKFRPRGMASNDAFIGSKNMDIWKMMNLCTNGENCKSNVNNYILGP